MSDFSKGGVHKTDESWWVIFQRGEYTKPMSLDVWFFKGGSTQNRWVLKHFGKKFYCLEKLSAQGVYFGKKRWSTFILRKCSIAVECIALAYGVVRFIFWIEKRPLNFRFFSLAHSRSKLLACPLKDDMRQPMPLRSLVSNSHSCFASNVQPL